MKNTYRKPYIYKVTSFETGQYYIGSQCSGKKIGVNYFTSSTNKVFRADFRANGEEKYEIVIIKEFEDPEECVRAENYLIWDHLQLKDGLCLNRACCCKGEKIFSRVGIHPTEETRKKQSMANKGLRAWNKGLPAWNKGIHPSEETRKRISLTKKGTHLSEETRKRLSLASPRRIKISIENTAFNSLTEAAQYHNVAVETIRYWLKNKKHNAFYIEK